MRFYIRFIVHLNSSLLIFTTKFNKFLTQSFYIFSVAPTDCTPAMIAYKYESSDLRTVTKLIIFVTASLKRYMCDQCWGQRPEGKGEGQPPEGKVQCHCVVSTVSLWLSLRCPSAQCQPVDCLNRWQLQLGQQVPICISYTPESSG